MAGGVVGGGVGGARWVGDEWWASGQLSVVCLWAACVRKESWRCVVTRLKIAGLGTGAGGDERAAVTICGSLTPHAMELHPLPRPPINTCTSQRALILTQQRCAQLCLLLLFEYIHRHHTCTHLKMPTNLRCSRNKPDTKSAASIQPDAATVRAMFGASRSGPMQCLVHTAALPPKASPSYPSTAHPSWALGPPRLY